MIIVVFHVIMFAILHKYLITDMDIIPSALFFSAGVMIAEFIMGGVRES